MILGLYCKAKVWWDRQEGSNMVEYVVIAALIVVGLFAVLTQLGCETNNTFQQIIGALKKSTPTLKTC